MQTIHYYRIARIMSPQVIRWLVILGALALSLAGPQLVHAEPSGGFNGG